MLAQHLYELDRSSTQFPEQLDILLHDKEWVEDLKLLPRDELVELMGYLNNILDDLDSMGLPFRKGLHILQKICSSRMILPSMYEVSGELSFDTMQIVAYGGFCDVYKGSLGGEGVCIKWLRITTTGDQAMVKQALCREAVVWKRLNHPNIVSFKGVTLEPLQLVSEWMPGGELREYIRNNREANLVNLLLGVAKGLDYLHSCDVIHGDLKGANILVDATGNAQIVDFGLATVARDMNSLVSDTDGQGNTPRYTAPEILKGDGRHSKESDIFSFGMVMIEVFTGNVPFSNLATATAVTSIVFGKRPKRPSHPSLTDHLWTLNQHCWKEKPQDRPQMDQVTKRLADQAPQTSLTQPIERPRYENPEVIQLTTASLPQSLGNTALLSLFPPFPQAPTNFFGRDLIIEDVLGLVERSASLIIFGAGGVGKTAIALTVLHHDRIAARFGRHRYFMLCDDLANSLDDFIEHLSGAIGSRHPMDMAQLRSHFTVSPPCIVVLDGVDSILDPLAPGAAEIATAIEEFGRCQNVCLLATSRMDVKISCFRRIEVPTLSEDDARGIFYSCCCLGRSVAVDNLLAELDFHPLSIDLLASAVHENGWDEPTFLKAWNDGKTSILKTSGRQSLEDTIESILRTPTIQELGTTARETLEAIAVFPSGVKEAKLENTFPRINGVGEAVNALCKFSLMYRQDGSVKMLSPFRFYFLESMQTTIYDSAAENIQYTRRGVNSGFPVDAGAGSRKDQPFGFDDRYTMKTNPVSASELPGHIQPKFGQQPDTPLGTKLVKKLHSAKRKLLALFRLSGGPHYRDHIRDGPAVNAQPVPPPQLSSPEATPYCI